VLRMLPDSICNRSMEQESERMTNFERIKAMSVEEMAEDIAQYVTEMREGYPYSDDAGRWEEWLESESVV